MTAIVFDIDRDTPAGYENAPATVKFSPNKARLVGTNKIVVPRVQTQQAPINVDTFQIIVDPTTLTWCWKIVITSGVYIRTRYVAVPDSATPIEYNALLDVNPDDLEPLPEPPDTAWVLLQGLVYESEAARDAAQAAETGAVAAQGGSEVARGASAASAQQAATSAGSAAGSATAAQTARTGAETAQTGAQAAKTAAETAQTGAQTAQTGAQTARTGAETAQTGAVAAQAAAETARDVAVAVPAGTPLGTLDLNTITTPGLYYQDTGGNATTVRNYPVGSFRGSLRVERWGTATWGRTQVYTTVGATSYSWVRSQYLDGTWGVWKRSDASRIVQPASQPGVEIYAYDDVNNVERMLLPHFIDLSTTDLNTVFTPGVYRQSSGGNGTTALNYPTNDSAGVLEVYRWNANSFATQRFIPYPRSTINGVALQVAGEYLRSYRGSSWSAWRFISGQRIVQPASQPGVEIYTFDDVNNVERLMQVASVDLGTVDLNVVTTVGSYKQSLNTNGTLVRNYPVDNHTGFLEVFTVGPLYVMQRFTALGGGSQQVRAVWQRRMNNGVWEAWRTITTQRVVQPAGDPGVEIYTWDDVSAVERSLTPQNLDLGTFDLNAVLTAGVYRQGDGTRVLLAKNYPVASQIGVLEVISTGNSRLQRWTLTANSTNATRGIYERTYIVSTLTWSAWTFVGSQRVDQTAGRVIYTWDDVNNREQIIYGDTGIRDISSLLDTTKWSGTASLARTGLMVQFAGDITPLADFSTETPITTSWPAGFTPSSLPFARIGFKASGTATTHFLRISSPPNVFPNGTFTLAQGAFRFLAHWRTNDVWPTALPGVPSGSIPNL